MTTHKLFTPWGQLPAPANDNLPHVVALAGAAGSGKSTAAQYLIRSHGYTRIKFAGPLKAMLAAIGLDDRQIEGDLKELPCDTLSGQSPRHAMQTLGAQWGRDCIGEDFWVNLWKRTVNDVLSAGGRVVTDDCRYPNEAAAVRRLGGDIYRLQGRGGIPGGHDSERQDFFADVIIDNDGGLSVLHEQLDDAMVRWG